MRSFAAGLGLAVALALLAVVSPSTPVAAANSAEAVDDCAGTTWIAGFRTRRTGFGALTAVRADEHTDSVSGDADCGNKLHLLCSRIGPKPAGLDMSTEIPARYVLPYSGLKIKTIGPIAGTDLTSRAVADGLCASRLNSSWEMASTDAYGDGGGYVASGVGLRAWVKIRDQRSNPWDTRSGKALTWTVWKDFESDLAVAANDFGYSNPYVGDTALTTKQSLLCINKLGLPDPGVPLRLPNGRWSGGQIALGPRILGSRLTSAAVADRLCRRDLGAGWQMAEFHDGGQWELWAAGNVARLWVASPNAGSNPWD